MMRAADRWALAVALSALASAGTAEAGRDPVKTSAPPSVAAERSAAGGVSVEVQVVMAAPIAAIERVLLDCSGYADWIPRVTSVRALGARDHCEQFEARIAFPWPIREVTEVLALERRAGREGVVIAWKRVRGDLRRNDAVWTLRSRGANRTEVTYRAVFQPQVWLPNFLLRRAERQLAPWIMGRLESRALALPRS